MISSPFNTKRAKTCCPQSKTCSTNDPTATMADEEDIAALVIDNGSGMCKGKLMSCRRGVLTDDAKVKARCVRAYFLSSRHIVGALLD